MSCLRQSIVESIHAIAGTHCQNLFDRIFLRRRLELRATEAAAEQRRIHRGGDQID